MGLHPPPHVVPKVLEKSRAIPLLTLRACVFYKKGENLHKQRTGKQDLPNTWKVNTVSTRNRSEAGLK